MLRIFRAKRRAFVIWLFVIVAFFLGGFIVIPGSGLNDRSGGQPTNEVGKVQGIPISRVDFENAMATQTQNYRNQFGNDPPARDEQVLEVQAWRSLVSQTLLAAKAQKLGLDAHDSEVVLSLRTAPPPQITTLPAFQTDGKFDANKYQQALSDPNINWSPFEELMRTQLPIRKLQERILTSIKMSEPELREAYRRRFERVSATLLTVPPSPDSVPKTPTEEDLKAAYESHEDLFAYPPRVQLEVLMVPREYDDASVREAQQLAQSLADRLHAGEDFATLARDYSEGGGAGKGGEVTQTLSLSDFGETAGPAMSTLQVGQITDPIRDAGRFLIFKLNEKPVTASGVGYKVSQIVIRIRASDEVVRRQTADLLKIRAEAVSHGLSKAATDHGLTTGRTNYFSVQDSPQELMPVPATADWGLHAKKGEVGPLFSGPDDYALVEVADKRPGGVASMDEVRGQLTLLFEREQRVEASKPAADAITAALAKGESLEQAGRAAGLTAVPVAPFTRQRVAPQLNQLPEVSGAIFAADSGAVVGPIRTLNGWYFAHVDQVTPADPNLYDQIKGQMSGEMLQQRQQAFLNSYLTELRDEAKVVDERFQR